MNIDITAEQKTIIQTLLQTFLPNTKVWAFGSRVQFTSRPESDLDLAAFIQPEQKTNFYALKEALEESDLPFRVDVLDWHVLPENFKLNIEKEYVVVQENLFQIGNLPDGWQLQRLSDFAEIVMGQSPLGETCNQDGNGTPLLNGPTEFGSHYPTAVQFTTNPKKISEVNDILFCVRGSTTGKMNWSNKQYAIGRGLASIRHKRGTKYRYFLKGIIDQNLKSLLGIATGSTFPNIGGDQLKEFKVIVPDLPTQQSIASILSSLDDKIELNLQMNQTLEIIAQAIFKEWFVDFNFPGFDGELIDGLPKGWRMGVISDIYKTTSGGTPSRVNLQFYENGTVKWVKSKELNGGFIFDTEEKITEEAIKNSSAKRLPRHSLLLAMYGATVGEYAVISSEATCNQAICAIIPNENYSYSYILEYIKVNKSNIINQASGSAQQNISQALIQRQEILIPPSEIVKSFHKVVGTLFEKIESNLFTNQTLTQLRDSLLPKLLTGKIPIKEA